MEPDLPHSGDQPLAPVVDEQFHQSIEAVCCVSILRGGYDKRGVHACCDLREMQLEGGEQMRDMQARGQPQEDKVLLIAGVDDGDLIE